MLFAIVFLLVLIILNGIFAMSELAMMTARRSRLQADAERGSKGAAAAIELAREPTRFLSTVQVGITLIGILSGAFAEDAISSRLQEPLSRYPALAPYSDGISLLLVVLIVTYFSLVLGELVPKRIALAFPEAVASTISLPLATLGKFAALPIRLLSMSTDLVVRLLRIKPRTSDDVSEEDVRSLVSRAAAIGVFTRQEHSLFNRTMRVADLTVGDLMVPRRDVVWIDENKPAEEMRVLVGTSPYSHFPVCRGSIDHIVGAIHLKDLIAHGLLSGDAFKVADIAHKPLFAPETMPALRILDEFKRAGTHVAFIVDEYGSTQGLVTLADVLSALIGDIARLGQEARPRPVRRSDGTWLLDGGLPLLKAAAALGIPMAPEDAPPDVRTVAGLVLFLLGRIPSRAEHADWKGWRFEVVDMDGRRIDQVLASPIPPETPASAP